MNEDPQWWQIRCPVCDQPVMVCQWDEGTTVKCPACSTGIEVPK